MEDFPDPPPAVALTAELPDGQVAPLIAVVSRVPLVLSVLAAIALLYVARPVMLPLTLACIAGVTLSPLMQALSRLRLPSSASAALVVLCLMTAIGTGFFQLGQPALAWLNDAPQHMSALRQRVQRMVPQLHHYGQAADAVTHLGSSEAPHGDTPALTMKSTEAASSIFNWTSSLLIGIGETLVLIYLILASGDLFLLKLVHVMPTLSDKKRAVDISRAIQRDISKYLFTTSLINLTLAVIVGSGLQLMDVPSAAMWGMLVGILNFVPYFGPLVGMVLLAIVGVLSFDTLWLALLPPAWFALLHLFEANLVTPVLLGRRFELNPVVIFMSLVFWSWLWGIPGAILSVPILVSVKAICGRASGLASLNEFLTD